MATMLAQAPSRAGLRLQSEPALARLLGIGRTRVRGALDLLVGRGFLVRRHGSGTYVRKVPPPPPATDDAVAPRLARRLRNGRLFASPPSSPPRLAAMPAQRRLRLMVWGELAGPNEANRLLIQGVAKTAEAAGHTLVFPHRPELAWDRAYLADQLRRHPCDGHIVQTHNATLVEQVLRNQPQPVVYISSGIPAGDCQPLIGIDLGNAMLRAVRILSDAGCRRIGIASLLNAQNQADLAAAADYVRARHLPAPAVLHLPLDSRALQRTARPRFAGRCRLDGVYVADNNLLPLLCPLWATLGLVPGRNLAVIAHANRGSTLPAGHDWSRMEFNLREVGKLTVDVLLRDIETAGGELCSFTHQAAWIPGATHRRTPAKENP